MNIGYEREEWIEDEDNLEKWESRELTASDRRLRSKDPCEKDPSHSLVNKSIEEHTVRRCQMEMF